ncbi:MAG: DUF87 domain-containing protein [Desulfurococcales archaeon]|nr:DUF87 domain-containing protein [Desulfurococcales archaeon]
MGSGYEWDLRLGVRVDGEGGGGGFGVRSSDLPGHIVVYGSVGAGKTTAAKRLLYEAAMRVRAGFVVVDWEGEYGDVADLLDARVLGGPDSGSPLRLGIFHRDGRERRRVPPSRVSEILLRFIREDGWDVTPQMERTIREAVRGTVESGSGVEGFRRMLASDQLPWSRQTAAAVEARLYNILEGELAPLLEGPPTLRVGPRERVVVDLSWLSSTSRSLARQAAQLVLASIQAQLPRPTGHPGLRMLVVIDEAEEVAPAGRPGQHWRGELVSDLMHQRKRGVGIVLVAHSPSLLNPEVARLASNIMVFRLDDADDAHRAAQRLGVGEELLRGLGRGEAVVRPASLRWPVVVRVEPPPALSWQARQVLESIALNPALTQRERRSSLGMRGSEYYRAVEELVRLGLARKVRVQTGWGRPVVLLERPGTIPGAAHRYLERALASRLPRILGAEVEKPRDADLALVSPCGARLAVEVETGSNIDPGKYRRLHARYHALLIVCTEKRCTRGALRAALDAGWEGRVAASILATAPAKARRLLSMLCA